MGRSSPSNGIFESVKWDEVVRQMGFLPQPNTVYPVYRCNPLREVKRVLREYKRNHITFYAHSSCVFVTLRRSSLLIVIRILVSGHCSRIFLMRSIRFTVIRPGIKRFKLFRSTYSDTVLFCIAKREALSLLNLIFPTV